MSVVAYTRLRALWGALDWQHGTEHPYSAAQTVSAGTDVVTAGGVGVRRAELVIDRSTAHPGGDVAVMHFDFLNMTGGAPDDTWDTTDFTTLEGELETFWNSQSSLLSTKYLLSQINWFRVGPGAPKPNPAERAFTLPSPLPGTTAGHVLPPQAACSITLRNGVRKSWGRTYLPVPDAILSTTGTLPPATVDSVVTAAGALLSSAAAGGFVMGTFSARLSAFLAAEHVEVDDVVDIQRRRRWKSAVYKHILP